MTRGSQHGKLCRMGTPDGETASHYHGATVPTPARRFSLLFALLAAALLAACTSHQTRPSSSEAGHRIPPIVIVDVAASDPQQANSVLIRAIGLVGVAYKWGGNTPQGGFDCSGLVNFVFRDMGQIRLPHRARDIAA